MVAVDYYEGVEMGGEAAAAEGKRGRESELRRVEEADELWAKSDDGRPGSERAPTEDYVPPGGMLGGGDYR